MARQTGARFYYKGYFLRKKNNVEYADGWMYLKPSINLDEWGYFELVYIVKNELKLKGDFEMWYKKRGKSLAYGKTQIKNDEDANDVLNTKDVNGLVNIYITSVPIIGPTNEAGSSKVAGPSNDGGPSKDVGSSKDAGPSQAQKTIAVRTRTTPRTKNSSYQSSFTYEKTLASSSAPPSNTESESSDPTVFTDVQALLDAQPVGRPETLSVRRSVLDIREEESDENEEDDVPVVDEEIDDQLHADLFTPEVDKGLLSTVQSSLRATIAPNPKNQQSGQVDPHDLVHTDEETDESDEDEDDDDTLQYTASQPLSQASVGSTSLPQ